jgi:hypothetical protein
VPHSDTNSILSETIQVGVGVRLSKDVQTTMIYTRVLNRGGRAVRSPLDR